ncbi:hypothetical protein B0J17DRAFT_153611 [Rhizoctonia solani]|nr:hypothetical protein B0J17DRAFT_153611 [Rhizoctonia solani]
MYFSDRLVELRLQRVIMDHDSTLADFLMRLASSPALRDLKIISVKSFYDEPEANRRVFLPNLNSLLLEDLPFNTLKVVLCTTSPGTHCLTLFPNQKSKQIIFLGNPKPEAVGIGHLTTLLGSVPVDTLLITGRVNEYGDRWTGDERWLSGAELHKLLISMPALKTFKIHTRLFACEEWQAMTRGENSQIPKLENLYFDRAFIKDKESSNL